MALLSLSFTRLALTGCLALLPGLTAQDEWPATPKVRAVEASVPRKPVVVGRGEGEVPLTIPDGEVLVFDAFVDLGLEARGGTVTLSSGSEPFSSGLPVPGQARQDDGMRTAWIESHAEGSHLGYKLDHTVNTRILPTDWPHYYHKDTQVGSENRKRELKIGVLDGKRKATERSNSHCSGCERLEHFVESNLPWGDDHHCESCKRMEHREWRDPVEREVPEGTVDLLAAVYMTRALIHEDYETVKFPMLTRLNLWTVTLTRGEEKKKKTAAGEFLCREVLLSSEIPEGEDSDKDFKGLFGMHGTIHIWVEHETGIPVVIEGRIPLGPLSLGVSVRLREFEGTPANFGPL